MTAFSKPARWTIGLIEPADVKAQWVGPGESMIHPAKIDEAKNASVDLEGCSWVWSPEPSVGPDKRFPPGTRLFRKPLELPADAKITRAKFYIVVDDRAELFVNGQAVAQGFGVKAGQVADLAAALRPGPNMLAIAATNGGDGPNPAAMLGKLIVELEKGEPIVVKIDDSWTTAEKTFPGWDVGAAGPVDWKKPVVIAALNEGRWGKIDHAVPNVRACPQLRKEFSVAQPIRRATVYASALGLYKLHLNGKPVGNDYFTPGWTDFNKRVYYNTYDVTELVTSGANAIGADLGAGWYAGAIAWKKAGNVYGELSKLFVQLEIELADGTVQTIVTDPSWKYAHGPRIEGEFLAGETYDARLETPGWDMPGFDEKAWKPVAATASIAPKFQGYPGVQVRETGIVNVKKVTEPKPGNFVFDLGQNFAGFARLKVTGPAGTKVVLRFAEMLNPDGTIYTTNLRAARCTDTYILRGEGEEVWQPQFTFHGFRYVEVTGYPGTPGPDAITGVAVNSNTPLVGSFECSSPMVNQLYSNVVWTQRANFIEVPTDCPQRDERLGWMGDAQVFVRAATYNADVAAFFTKWLVDVDDAQRADGSFTDVSPDLAGLGSGTAAWADAGMICPWIIHWVYNDQRVLAEHYPAMVRFVDYCEKHGKDLIRPAEGYGDWLSINDDTPKDLLATAYFGYSTKLAAEAARTLGKTDDAKKYDALFGRIKEAFIKAYVSSDGRVKSNSQTSYVVALAFDLLPADKREAAAGFLVENIKSRQTHLSTGFNGTAYLMPTLAATGHNDIAYKLFLNDTFPSWGYSIKHGATSIWERWDGWTADKGFQDPGMNSFAHYSFGAVARWMFQTVAGIGTFGPGFQQLDLAPAPGEGLTWVKAHYDSIHGRIASAWKIENGKLVIDITIPANTTATVTIPAANPLEVTEGGRPLVDAADLKLVSKVRAEIKGGKVMVDAGGKVVVEAKAGTYHFVAPWKK